MTDESNDVGAGTEQQTDSAAVIAAITAERDRFKDAALRALADLDNFRKRSIRERDEVAKKAKEDMLRELLPVFDNLERASQYVTQGADAAAIGKGIEMVLKLFEDTLNRVGGKRVRSVGEPFDPQVHEAISQLPSDAHPAGVIAAEAAAGYLLGDRLLRAAMVVVSTGPGPSGATASAATASGDESIIDEAQLEFDPRKG
jgi:molecular chaperone GrpE